MKRIVLHVILVVLIFLSSVWGKTPCQAKESETTINENKLYAQSAVLMDADSGRVLFEKKGDAVLPMASTTKIMTCIITLENGNLEDYAQVSDYAASMPKVRLSVQKGERYRLRDLLYSLMLESHNDAAVVIAEHIGGSVEGFAEMMNKKAEEIGCKQTCFLTPNGLDAQKEILTKEGEKKTVMHATTAKDLALIMSYCIKKSPQKEEFLKITGTPSYNFSNEKGTRNFSCNNHNAFLNMMEGAVSGKTGFTGKAGYCYVGALERDGKTFVVSLLACGWPNNKTYKWSDTKKLMQYGLSNYQKRNLAKEAISKEWLFDIPVEEAKTRYLYGKAAVPVYIEEEKEAPSLLMKEEEKIEVSCEIEKSLTAPVKEGQEVGKIRYLLDGSVLWERKVCAKASVEQRDFLWFFKMAAMNFLV